MQRATDFAHHCKSNKQKNDCGERVWPCTLSTDRRWLPITWDGDEKRPKKSKKKLEEKTKCRIMKLEQQLPSSWSLPSEWSWAYTRRAKKSRKSEWVVCRLMGKWKRDHFYGRKLILLIRLAKAIDQFVWQMFEEIFVIIIVVVVVVVDTIHDIGSSNTRTKLEKWMKSHLNESNAETLSDWQSNQNLSLTDKHADGRQNMRKWTTNKKSVVIFCIIQRNATQKRNSDLINGNQKIGCNLDKKYPTEVEVFHFGMWVHKQKKERHFFEKRQG